jgi:hypothetical protein
MSFLKAVFFTLPLMAIAAIGLAYLLSTQTVQPRIDEVLLKLETATTQMEASRTESEATAEALRQINAKLDTLIARP